MTDERYKEIMESPGTMTDEEWNTGWHHCVEWDGLLVGPGMSEADCCCCEGLSVPPIGPDSILVIAKIVSGYLQDLTKSDKRVIIPALISKGLMNAGFDGLDTVRYPWGYVEDLAIRAIYIAKVEGVTAVTQNIKGDELI